VTTEVEKASAKVKEIAGATKARITEKDAAAARKLHKRQGALDLKKQKAQLKLDKRAGRVTNRDTKKTNGTKRRRAQRQACIKQAAAAVKRAHAYAAANSASVYSTTIYAMAVGVAVSGQIDVASDRGWSIWLAVGAAVFLEGLALAMALTAHQLRLEHERAFIPRALTWIAASFAAAINFGAHMDDLVKAAVLGASSLAAIIVWEVRSGAKHRKQLRADGYLPPPPERFGWRRWVRYFPETWAAWSLDVKHRVSEGAARLIEQVQENREGVSAVTSAEAALDSEYAAETARKAAGDSAETAARHAAEARTAASEAVRAAKRTAPRFSFFRKSVPAAETAPASVPEPIETAPGTVDPKRPGTSSRVRTGTAPTETPAEARPEMIVEKRLDADVPNGSGRRTGSAKAAEDAALLERLKTQVPREPDDTVPVRRAMRELGGIGSGRATRLLQKAGLHGPTRSLVSTNSGE
jgi:hypothetical protein